MTPTVLHPTNFAAEAAALILERARAAIAARGIFRIALAGGNTPRAVHEALAASGEAPAWQRWQVTFGDERCVPPDDKDSNFRMARESLFDRAPIPAGNIFRVRGEIDPEAAASEYEEKLAAVAARFGEERYRHDLLILGMGEDGHTASLFPDSPALAETVRNVIPATGPKPPPQRVTMTFPLLNAAREVCFMATRKGKEEVLERVIAGDQQYPAARVRPVHGSVTWLVG
jgi:6-phosphogluconolactonase